MDFKLMVKSENVWVSKEEMNHVPDVIQKEYEYLKESIQKDDICGALFRLKDIYEISMKIPAIMAIISICSYIKADNDFIRKTNGQLLQEHTDFMQGNRNEEESEAFQKFGVILSRLLREPLSIGGWRELTEKIVEYSTVFDLDDNLESILSRTVQLHKVKPKKANRDDERYEDVGNWRNKTIGHGTLSIHTEDYWEQIYDLVSGLHLYFSTVEKSRLLNDCYENINIVQENTGEYVLQVGNKRHIISEYIYFLEEKLIKGENEDAQIAFLEYLDLFRRRYEDELYGDGEGDAINLVYIIDGIDELSSDTRSMLNAIPSNDTLRELPDEVADHVYIVLLSRVREEESLPDAAKECINISEQKSGTIFTVGSNNEEYIALLKNYISHNYKGISKPAYEEIIERAQRKFLYIQPYMALGIL